VSRHSGKPLLNDSQKLFHFYISIVCLIEGTAEQITEAQMITMASGAFQEIQVEELVSTKAMKTAMTNAGAIAAKYKAPNK
jgi:K+-transporting ATPase A subunit